MKKKKNQLYKKIITWKKKPNYNYKYGGLACCVSASLIGVILCVENSQVAFLSFIFTLMFVYGYYLNLKGKGKGKKIYYIKK